MKGLKNSHTAYIALGSNLGDRMGHLRSALGEIEESTGAPVQASSGYETDPVGHADQPRFVNAACRVETTLGPRELLTMLLEIETAHDRVRTVRDEPRTLDLDLLLYEDRVIGEPGLIVPHPRMAERAFVLVPLAEIAPDAVEPVSSLTVRELLERLPETAREVGPPVALRP